MSKETWEMDAKVLQIMLHQYPSVYLSSETFNLLISVFSPDVPAPAPVA